MKRKFSDNIIEKLETLPLKPGIYIMRDEAGEIIYVGKSKALRNRVRSYFQDSAGDGRRQFNALVSRIRDFEYIVTDSEVEALILEANLIKEHKPRYNISLKDDKKYPFVKITKEPFPRLLVTRKVDKDGARYLGPYTDVRGMRRTLDTLFRIFPIRNCDIKLPSPRRERACLMYHIKRCGGPCENFISQEEYGKVVHQAELFLLGRSDEVVKTLIERMGKAAEDLKFEMAAQYRDRLVDLQSVMTKQKVLSVLGEDWDIVGVASEDDTACGVVLEVRRGKLLGRKHFFLNGVIDSTKSDITGAFIQQFYIEAMFIPTEIYLPCEIDDITTVSQWLSEKRAGSVKLHVPQKGEKLRLIRMAEENAGVLLAEWRAKREKLADHVPNVVMSLQRDLRLVEPPRRIECIDISNIQGSDSVASLVSFWDGKPRKSEYRHYKIEGIEGPNDFAMMKQVVTRRFQRLIDEEKDFPDLLVVDGGKGQLSSAIEALKELGIDEQPLIGLAKRLEEVFVPGVSDPQNIPKTSSTLKLLQQIRDEAHRFAVTYHRKVREKRTLTSELDGIPGIGEKKKFALLRKFGSITNIAQAQIEEINSVEGIGEKLARIVKERLMHDT